MFKRNHHVRIATILQALDAALLTEKKCLFGGGTAIVLSHGEYRESVDIDFLISDLKGYRELRESLKEQNDLSAITRQGFHLNLSREIRADQYGIRTMIDLGGVAIKFEVVFEGRIALQNPATENQVCGVSTLTKLDMATSKLLANSDRWSDDSVFNRDLIDLAMMDLSSKTRKQALEKASIAYGDSAQKDLKKAIAALKSRRGRLQTCMTALKMTSTPEALLWQKIKKLE